MEAPATYDWLDDLLDASEKTLGLLDIETMQPTSWRHAHPLFAKEWLDWFYTIIQEVKKQSISRKQLFACLSPALWRMHFAQFILEDFKSAQYPKEKRMEIVDFFQPLIMSARNGDYFAQQGTNLPMTEEQVSELLQRPFVEGNAAGRELAKMFNATYNMGAGMYIDFYLDKVIENQGPYPVGKNQILVVKEMRFLSPTEIFPKVDTGVEKMTWYAVYENLGFRVSLIPAHSQYDGQPIPSMIKWRLEKDGKEVTDVNEIKAITAHFTQLGKEYWNTLTAKSEQDLIKQCVRVRCFVFKPLCDLLGIDWKPPQSMIDKVQGKHLTDGYSTWKPPADEQEALAYWKKIWDPRLDFYP
jgi:hypothetical protein